MAQYNKIAGQNTQRIEAISDGVFAVAMTLLVLEIKEPLEEVIHSEADLANAFFALMPKFLVYFLSFMTVGIFWTGQATQFRFIEKSDRNFNWLNLILLLFISLIPFSTALLGDFITFKFAIGLYWFNLLLLGASLYVNWKYALKNDLASVSGQELKEVDEAISKRIIVAQALYAGGALLCFVNPYLSIAVIIAIQLNYAFGIISGKKE